MNKESLPFSDRPAENAPGHWVLARAGKKVLRPGGLGLTRQLLRHCGLSGKDVVELAPGLGRTAREIVATGPRSYTGVDQDSRAAARVEQVVAGIKGTCRQGDAAATGLDPDSADVVIGEAMLTMQSPRAKAEIVAEAVRVLRPGGIYAIHELGLAPDDLDPEVGTEISRALARAIHVNARPLTLAQWRALLEEHGLVVEWTEAAPMALLKMRRNLADEGPLGVLRMMWNLIRHPDLRRRVLSMRATFRTYEEQMRGVALVARKPA
ncbi:class I SAM-dependent methyltransferase [Arachnia propionica]|uniref:Class I SAM-dependent methyltransferase n=1 Tax=Arachnia propionica TaxID=1750 RepID=A0A3P1TD31_9ACTN|nr:class I SAM-dependent methyltransferase [Arachnia propionica]RRD07361.1 class I SAM-dependent methyltransferase [Arachnia propionica]